MKTVPLVFYKGKERIVIGEAFVEWDEDDISVRATIKDEFLDALVPLVSAKGVSEAVINTDYSIGFPFAKESISAQHARLFGVPVPSEESINKWAATIEGRIGRQIVDGDPVDPNKSL